MVNVQCAMCNGSPNRGPNKKKRERKDRRNQCPVTHTSRIPAGLTLVAWTGGHVSVGWYESRLAFQH